MKSGAFNIYTIRSTFIFAPPFRCCQCTKAIIQNPSLAQRNPALPVYPQQEFIFETDIKNKDRILLQKKYALNSHRFYR
ncbi:hypothetical protein A1704_12125 [Chryseobacterium cucumeris]|nr:hypothetical protein A1704_12125 [Chryseobacterium cucumeris]